VKNGTTDRCAHEGCPIILIFKNGGWVHAIRNRPYDHKPTPQNHEPAEQVNGLTGFAAMEAINAMVGAK